MIQIIQTIWMVVVVGFWLALYYWWVILLFILGGIAMRWMGFGAVVVIEKSSPPQPTYSEVLPAASPVLNPDRYVEYAMRNPSVKLDMVEKVTTDDDRFSVEKHMKMSGPLEPPRPFVAMERYSSYFPATPKKKWWE
jgi:hypothetical protein